MFEEALLIFAVNEVALNLIQLFSKNYIERIRRLFIHRRGGVNILKGLVGWMNECLPDIFKNALLRCGLHASGNLFFRISSVHYHNFFFILTLLSFLRCSVL